MPNYNANIKTSMPMNVLYGGDPPVSVVNAEQPAAGQASQQVSLGKTYGQDGQHQCYASSSFAVAPGAVSWKVQHASTDVDAAYTDIAVASSTNVNGDNIVFQTNLPFIRIVTVTQPNQNMTIRVGIS